MGDGLVRIVAMAAMVFVAVVVACGGGGRTSPNDVERGGALYSQQCQVCHGDPETGQGAVPNAPVHGPDGHTWHHADGQLAAIVLGQLEIPGRTMPSFGGRLSEADVLDILAYLKTGWEPDQLEFQEEVSRNWEELYPPE